MALETASFIGQLDAANPTGSDPKSLGDNHLRLIKGAVKGSFPNLGNEAVTATAAQINIAALSSGQYATGTSTTSLLIGTGTKAFTTQTARAFGVGQRIKLTSQANIANYMLGTCSAYDTTTGAMSVSVDSVGGSGTFADWSVTVFLDASQSIQRQDRTSDTIITSANNGQWINITSGTFTQSIDTAANLGAGRYFYLGNIGSGDITVTMDGVTFKMYTGELRLVQSDGTNLTSRVLNAGVATITATGLYTKPPGYRRFDGFLWGSGSGGAKASSASGGGGGGACTPFSILSSAMPATVAVTIGTGGAGATVDGTPGVAGTNSSFGSFVSAYTGGTGISGGGGGGGIFSAAGGTTGGAPTVSGQLYGTFGGGDGGTGGSNTPSYPSVYGGGGGCGTNAASVSGLTGAPSIYGGGGGGGGLPATSAGGSSVFGGAGGAGNNTTSGVDGTAPGGGGGGTRTGAKGGNGARGECRVFGVI